MECKPVKTVHQILLSLVGPVLNDLTADYKPEGSIISVIMHNYVHIRMYKYSGVLLVYMHSSPEYVPATLMFESRNSTPGRT